MSGYTYKGYTYRPWDECDDDCSKIWHEFKGPDGEIVTCDWSPYVIMKVEDINLWIDLGMPERIGYGPLDHDDLLEIRREQLETAMALNSTFID